MPREPRFTFAQYAADIRNRNLAAGNNDDGERGYYNELATKSINVNQLKETGLFAGSKDEWNDLYKLLKSELESMNLEAINVSEENRQSKLAELEAANAFYTVKFTTQPRS